VVAKVILKKKKPAGVSAGLRGGTGSKFFGGDPISNRYKNENDGAGNHADPESFMKSFGRGEERC